MFAKRGGRASSSGPSPNARLDELEVREAREAVAAAERETDDELSARSASSHHQPVDDRERERAPDDRLVEPRSARVDHVEVAVRIGERCGRFIL